MLLWFGCPLLSKTEILNIKWNKRLVKFEKTENGVTAYFEDGTTASGTILIGAEGGNSRTRELLCPETFQLQPLGVRSTGLAVKFTPEQAAPLRAYDPLLFQGMHPETEDFMWYSSKPERPQHVISGTDKNTSDRSNRYTSKQRNRRELLHRSIHLVLAPQRP